MSQWDQAFWCLKPTLLKGGGGSYSISTVPTLLQYFVCSAYVCSQQNMHITQCGSHVTIWASGILFSILSQTKCTLRCASIDMVSKLFTLFTVIPYLIFFADFNQYQIPCVRPQEESYYIDRVWTGKR